ncbi:MAG: response regulator transcription factor [Alphaproteobacteria bacterium]|nr:response regulator transcription factor [Alphaproteobacteria bacterium]
MSVPRVVLVDDHEMVREALCTALVSEGDIEVVGEAATCVAALAVVASARPDVLVLDYNLSDGSAMTVIPEIRAKHPSVRILVLTVHDNAHYATRCIQAGAHGFLAKSGPVRDLRAAVHRVHAGEMVIPAHLTAEVVGSMRSGGIGIDALSPREFELLRLLGSGATLKEAAERQNISTSTASTYRARLMEKLSLRTTGDIIRFAIENDLAGRP